MLLADYPQKYSWALFFSTNYDAFSFGVDAIQVIQMNVESIPAKSFCHPQSSFRQ